MSIVRLTGSWLVGVGLASIVLAVVRGEPGSLVFSVGLTMVGFLLLTRSRPRAARFPGTDFERDLDRLFALLLPTRRGTSSTTVRVVVRQQIVLARLKRSARRWGKELQLFTTDGYETASRISALSAQNGHDDEALVAEAVRVLRAERATAGADLTLADDRVSMLAYGLGARPVGVDLTSLEDLLHDLGLSGEVDELRTHFDDVVAAKSHSTGLHLRNNAERSMFRELAGASFVLGAAARILELASLTSARDRPFRAAAA